MAALRLTCNSTKTEVASFDAGVRFLGTTIRSQGGFARDAHEHPRRISVVVAEAGAIIRLRKGRMRVDRDDETVAAIALSRVSQVVVQGRVGLTTPFLHEAMRSGIDVVLLSESGGYLGRMSRRRMSAPAIRRAQYAAGANPEQSLILARAFVSGKIANMRVNVLRATRQVARSESDGDLADALDRIRGHTADAITTPSLMGLEGAASRQYFSWLIDRVGPDWGFDGRHRRPPPDPINAMLSYGYTILTSEVIAACEQAGLDPDMGFLHSDRWGRPSLALDLVEEWRPVLVDSVVLRLVATSQLSPADFTIDSKRGCRMSDDARRKFLVAYQKRMLTIAGAASDGGREAYRRLLVRQARALAECLEDGSLAYHPHVWR